MTTSAVASAVRSPPVPAETGALVVSAACALLLGLRQSFTVPLTLGLSPAQLILLVGGILWLATRIAGQRIPGRSGPLPVAAVVYLLAAMWSYGCAMTRPISAGSLTTADRVLFIDVSMVLAFFFVVSVVRTTAGLALVAKGLVLGGVLSATFAIVQQGTGADLAVHTRLPGLKNDTSTLVVNLMREGVLRPQGSAGHPLELGAVLTVLVPLALGIMYRAKARGEPWWHWALMAVVLGSGAAVTMSRSPLVGLTAALVVMGWAWPARRLGAVLAAVGGILLVSYLAGFALLDAFARSVSGMSTDSSLQSRAEGAQYVYEHFSEHLWFGQGPGTYPGLEQPVLDNHYLSTLMNTGVVGVAAFAFLMIAGTVCAVRSSDRLDRATGELSRGIAGALAALIVIALILDIAGFAQVWTLAWILCALACSAWRLGRVPQPAACDH